MKIRFPLRLAASVLISFVAAALGADEKPPDEAFEGSAFDFRFQIPDSFISSTSGRGYLQTASGKAPYLDLSWTHDSDFIVVRLLVMPAVDWEKSPTEMFADAKKNMLSQPDVKLLSERDYQVEDCQAHSFVFYRRGNEAKFERVDYFLTKPDLNIVVYSSPGKAALDCVPCQELFQSISIQAKPPKKADSARDSSIRTH